MVKKDLISEQKSSLS